MEVWTHGGERLVLTSFYSLPDDAWSYELTAMSGVRRGNLAVLVPDATPSGGPFTPLGAAQARVLLDDGAWPWPVLVRFVRFVEDSGDIVSDPHSEVAGDLSLTKNDWRFGQRRFETNSFWLDDPDCWSYELYELGQPSDHNDYLDVRIPNLNLDPGGGAFMPDHAERVAVNVFGTWELPWPVLVHFIAAVEATGDIVSRPAEP